MKVLVLHTLAPAAVGDQRSADEFDLGEGAAHVASVLDDAVLVGVRGEAHEVLAALHDHRPDVVFNLCEAPLGQPALETHAASLLEWVGQPFTGSGSVALALCRDKPRVGAWLAAQGVPVPRSDVYPVIVKPADEDGSAGIFTHSVCADAAAVERARARWSGPVLVQEFLDGREFVVALWGRDGPEQASIGETLFRNGLLLNTYASKWDTESAEYGNSPLHYDTPIDPALREQLLATARAAWRLCGVRGYLRVDLRCNAAGVPCVLDVNPNPAIGEGIGICRAVAEAGGSWREFVHLQLEVAHAR